MSGDAEGEPQMKNTVPAASTFALSALTHDHRRGFARADDCELADDGGDRAGENTVMRPTTHVTSVPGETPALVQMVFTADRAYVQMNGAWRSMAYSPQAQIDKIEAARKTAEQAKQSCEKTANEAVKGEAATVLLMHNDVNGKKSEARVWISDQSGLLLKSEFRIDNGANVAIVTDDFRYDDIAAPSGVKVNPAAAKLD